MINLLIYSLVITSNNFIPKNDIQSFVYHLELENNSHYVGITKNLNQRWSQHVLGKGSKWTKLHKPITIRDFIIDGNKDIENEKTYELMDKYGIDKVRGGVCHCPILKDCEKYGCKYTSKENKEFKIIQEYYNLLQKDWVQELCYKYNTDSSGFYESNIEYTKKLINSMKIINSKWYYVGFQNSLVEIKIINEPLYGFDKTIGNEVKILNNVFKINLPIENIYYIYTWEKGIIENTLVKYRGIIIDRNTKMFNHVNSMFNHYLYLKIMNKN